MVLVVFGSTISCSPSSTPYIAPTYWPTENWQSSSPEAQGMDLTRLAQMFEYIEDKDINLHSLLIARNGYLVTEAYWHPYGPEDKHTTESITKSVIGTLIGIAIDQGAIKDVDQKLLTFFPRRTVQNLDNAKKSITLRDLLSMTPGLDCEDSKSLDSVNRSNDWVQSLLDLPMASRPGSKWVYCSGASHLLSAVLEEATGVDTRAYANRYLFRPLGIQPVSEEDWNSDPQGVTNGMAGLYLTPRDLAKYGFLYLNSGKWDRQQVLSSKWVHDSTCEQAYIGRDEYVGGLDRRFGYFWSIFPKQQYYGYLGRAGQELFVLPQENIVVVFTGALEVGKEGVLLNIINDYIVPSVLSNNSISSDPDARAKLNTFVLAAAGSEQPVPPLPPLALEISGKTYKLGQNFLGWSDMTFYFKPESDEANLKMQGSPDLKIGMDDRYRLTEMPDSRPTGLRGRWIEQDTFYLDYIIFEDFIRSEARIQFEGKQMTVTIKYLNWNNPPIVLHGIMQE